MKLYYLKLGANRMKDFIKFSITYNISIFFTWSEETFFGERIFFATVTTQADAKITSEEKERLLNENWLTNTTKVEQL